MACEFKVGDRVRVVNYPKEEWNNRIGVVNKVLPDNAPRYHRITFEDGAPSVEGSFHESFLELVSLDFKVGDRVKILYPNELWKGQLGTIDKVTVERRNKVCRPLWFVKLDDRILGESEAAFYSKELELLSEEKGIITKENRVVSTEIKPDIFIRPGDVVVLKSGGPKMSVETTRTFKNHIWGADCVWFVGDMVVRSMFWVQVLKKVEE